MTASFDLKSELSLSSKVVIADIGAADFGAPELHLALRGNAHFYCFDANPDEREKLDRSDVTVLSYAIADGSEHTLYCAPAGMASLLEPDEAAWRYYTLFSQPPFLPISKFRTEKIPTKRLDDVTELPPVDFLKVDTQGSELMILQNGRMKLSECAVVHIEMAFVATYKQQPLFADVDAELRQQGFMAHGFASMKRMPVMPYAAKGFVNGINQVIDLDMIYIRDLITPSLLTDDQLRKTAFILHTCYGSHDVALRCLVELAKRLACSPDLPGRYFESIRKLSRRVAISQFPALQLSV